MFAVLFTNIGFFLVFVVECLFVFSEPRRQFEIVFRMIDVDGSDSIDVKEFELVNYY